MASAVSSVLTEISQASFESERDRESAKAGLISRLLSSDWTDSTERVSPEVFSMLTHSEEVEKIQGWRLLRLLLNSQYRCHMFVVKPLCQFIDKHSLLNTLKGAKEAPLLDAIYEGVRSILSLALDVDKVSTSIDNQLVKLVGYCMDQVKDSSTTLSLKLFAIQILTDLTIAKGRLFTPQQLHKCMSTSFFCLSDSHLYEKSSYLLAVCTSHCSCDLFEATWKNLCQESGRLLRLLGLNSGRANDKLKPSSDAESSQRKVGDSHLNFQFKVSLKSDFASDGDSLVGIRKALFIESSYRGVCSALSNMLLLGNSSGAIAQDFRIDLAPSLNTAICHRSAINSSDARFIIENDAGISPAHVSVVWPQLTLHALSLFSVLLSSVTPPPLLYPFAGTACACISSALSRAFPSSSKKVQKYGKSDVDVACAIQALECFEYALRSFPTLVLSKCENIILQFIDVLNQQMQYLTSNPQDNIDVSDVIFTNKELVLASFCACETLVINSSTLLPYAVRQQLEGVVHRGLQCLVKGVVFHSFLTLDQIGNSFSSRRTVKHVQQNKKMRRELCEILRSDVDIQKVFLLLSCAEVQTLYVDGSRSANTPLLRSAAGVCASHTVTASVCCRINLAVGNILFPSGVGISGPPLIEFAHKKVLEHFEYTNASNQEQPRHLEDSFMDNKFKEIRNEDAQVNNSVGNSDDETVAENSNKKINADNVVDGISVEICNDDMVVENSEDRMSMEISEDDVMVKDVAGVNNEENSKKRKLDAEGSVASKVPPTQVEEESQESISPLEKNQRLDRNQSSVTTKNESASLYHNSVKNYSSDDDDDELPDIDINADIDQ